MKTIKYFAALLLSICSIFLIGCDEEIATSETNTPPPSISSFSPTSGEVGADITIKGDNLHKVMSVTIGGGNTPIKYRIDRNTLIVTVATTTQDGGITLTNDFGVEVSYDAETFTVDYKAPVLSLTNPMDLPVVDPALVAAEGLNPGDPCGVVGQSLVLYGEDMHFVESINFVREDTTKVEGTITYQSKGEIVVEVPLIDDSANVELEFTYNDKDGQRAISQGDFYIIVLSPVITTNPLPASLDKYTPITLEGLYLDLYNSFSVRKADGTEIDLVVKSKSESSVVLDLASDYFEASFIGDLIGVYNENKERVIAQNFELTADPNEPRYKKYTNVFMDGRYDSSLAGGTTKAFMDLDSGVVYNADDVVSAASVIDMVFYDNNGNAEVRGGDNSGGIYKNYKTSAGINLDDIINSTDWGATTGANVVDFRVLDPAEATHKAVIDAYEAGDIVFLSDDSAGNVTDPRVTAVTAPSSSSFKTYASRSSYGSNSADPNTYRYVLVRRKSPDDKYGIIKVNSVVFSETSGYGQSITFDCIWSL